MFGLGGPEVAESLHSQAQLHLAQGQLSAASSDFLQAFSIDEQVLRSVITEARIASRLQKEHFRFFEDDVYSLQALQGDDSAVQRLSLSVALLRKGRSAQEGLQTQYAIRQSLDTPNDHERFEHLISLRSQIANMYFKDATKVPNYQKTLQSLEAQADELERKMAEASTRFRSSQLPGPDQVISQVAKALPEDAEAALLEIALYRPFNFKAVGKQERWTPPRYLAMVLLSNGQIRATDLGPAAAIDTAVQQFLADLTHPKADLPMPLEAAQQLNHLVMAPLRPLLAGRTKLWLSLDGQLQFVPFAALHDGQDFLLNRYRFSYLTSGRDLLRTRTQDKPATSVAIFADPAFAATPQQVAFTTPEMGEAHYAARSFQVGHISALPGTRQEAEALHKVFPRAKLYLGPDATEPTLLGVKAPGILHVATHGLFLADPAPLGGGTGPTRRLDIERAPGNPLLRSALVMAGAQTLGQERPEGTPGSDSDGLATALEVSGMNLWGTQLVVLSACDTGRGTTLPGQGVYGLRRAFFIAGAETLVTSLWKVSDQVTRDLMTAYYDNLVHGQGRVEAMDHAADQIRQHHPHPYFWAPFIVLGRGDPLRGMEAAAR